MTNSELEAGQLTREREAIARSGRLHWFHWAIISLSLVLTLGAWFFVKQQIDAETESQFGRARDQVLELVSERMQRYEDGLWGGVSAIQARGGRITFDEWRVFAENLRIDLKYPGINGIGVIHHVLPGQLDAYLADQRRSRPDYGIHPAHGEAEFLPITYIEPARANAKAVGLDMAHEANRYRAALMARDTGVAQITGPIILVQDENHTPGFLFYAPFYAGGTYDTIEGRRDRFAGMVYAPFVFHKLMQGVLEKEKRQVRIRVSDGEETLYDERGEDDPEHEPAPLFDTKVDLELYGRTWTFDVWTTKSFREAADNGQPALILVGGLTVDSLLFLIFVLLSRSNRRAVDFADRMTLELQNKASALEHSNAELERFAYVASHDLKTPLRGIDDLTEYLEEDLETYMGDPDANPDVRKNLLRLHDQVGRMDNLIKGILSYSSLGSAPKVVDKVDSRELALTLAAGLELREDQMLLKGTWPEMITDVVRFEQILENLISNARKHHHAPERALVTMTAGETSDYYVFSVADNGPGIDPQFHARIFEAFQTLQSKDVVDSTGIGLSIVKKAVERHGGRITLSSDLGQGAEFTFEWPKAIYQQSSTMAAE